MAEPGCGTGSWREAVTGPLPGPARPRPRSRPAARPPRPARWPRLHHDLRLRGPDRLGQAGRLPGAQPGQRGHAQRRGVRRPGHLDRDLQQVGLGLEQQPRPGQPAVRAQRRQRLAEIGGHRPGQQRHRRGQAVQHRADQVRAAGAQAQAEERAAGVRPPVRRAQAGQRGHEPHAAAVGHRRADAVQVGGRGDDAEPGQPAHRRAGRVDLAVQAVVGRARQPPGDRRGQARGGPDRPAARGREQERPGAVGALGLAGLQAVLPEQRRLLVHGQPGHRHRRPERRRLADHFGAVRHRRQRGRGQAEHLAGPLRPVGGVQVEQHRPGRGGRVGHVPGPEPGQQPGVGGGDHAVGGQVLAQPGHLGRGEVRIERQPGDRGQAVGLPGQPGADAGRAPVLPDDGRGQRPSGPPVPGQHGLALVGQGHRIGRGAGRGQGLPPGGQHRLQQLGRVGLHGVAAGPGGHRRLAGPEHLLPGTDEQRLGGRRALVDGEDVHGLPGTAPAAATRSRCSASGPRPARPRHARPPRCASPTARSATGPGRRPGPRRAPRARSTERPGTRWARSGRPARRPARSAPRR